MRTKAMWWIHRRLSRDQESCAGTEGETQAIPRSQPQQEGPAVAQLPVEEHSGQHAHSYRFSLSLRQVAERASLPLSLFADLAAALAVVQDVGLILLSTVVLLSVAISLTCFALYLRRDSRGRAVVGAVSLVVAVLVGVLGFAGVGTSAASSASRDGLVTAYASVSDREGSDAVDVSLERYFAAINSKNYKAWSEVVTSVMVGRLDEEQWNEAYKTTRITSAQIVTLDGAQDGGAATVRYTSEQALQDAPPDLQAPVLCWTTRFSFDTSSGTLKLNVVSTTKELGPC